MFLSGNLKVEEDALTGLKKLLEDVVYQDGDKTYVVPAGYETDYASIPRCISWIYPKDGPYRKAAVVHDWLITDLLPTGQIKSTRVDEIFREAMDSVGGIPKIRQWIMWAGVRIGAVVNKNRRKGSLKTLPKVLGVVALASPLLLIPSLAVQLALTIMWLLTLPLPKHERISAQKT